MSSMHYRGKADTSPRAIPFVDRVNNVWDSRQHLQLSTIECDIFGGSVIVVSMKGKDGGLSSDIETGSGIVVS